MITIKNNIIKIIISLFILLNLLGLNVQKNSELQVDGLNLKINLIETAYELYSVNILNKNNDIESLYKNISNNSHKHYEWLIKTYNSMDTKMKQRLHNIFKNHSSFEYINQIIYKDIHTKDEIIKEIIKSDINLTEDNKNDFKIFFDYFYDEYFDKYFKRQERYYNRLSKKLNNTISKSNINLKSFLAKNTNIQIKNNYKTIFYYTLNPLNSHNFVKDNIIINTIFENSNLQDILKIPINEYSNLIFSDLTNNKEFIDICKTLKNDEQLNEDYKEFKDSYTFENWCIKNLSEGFSKYLDLKYLGYKYDFKNYTYDLEFYNYLNSKNLNKENIYDICIEFYKEITKN